MEFDKIKKELQNRVEEVVLELFPEARKEGSRYLVGSIEGESGSSLRIETDAGKAGVWKDFATDECGSIVWLFIKKFGRSEGYLRIRKFLGISEDFSKYGGIENTIPYTPPKPDWDKGKPKDEVIEYLLSRGIRKEILKSYHVKSATKFFPSAGKALPCYVFPYFDEEHKLCNIKYVALERNEKGKKHELSSKNAKHSLFGLNRAFKNVSSESKFFAVICEGELDALSVAQAGYAAVSPPYGCSALQWIDVCYKFLYSFAEIYILFDNDDKGQKAAKIVSGRLGLERCKIVRLPEGIKDANKLINELDGEDTLIQCIESATYADHDKIANPESIVQLTVKSFKAGRSEDQGIPWCGWEGRESINWKVRPSEMTIHCGYPGGGKTTNLLQGMAYLTLVKNHKCAIASTEVEPYTLMKTMTYQAIGRDLDHTNESDIELFRQVITILMDRIYLYDFRGIAKIADLMDFARYCCKVKGVEHFVLDSLTNSDIDLEDGNKVTQFLNSAVDFMVNTGVHYHLVAHLRKGDMMDIRNIPKFDAVKGTGSFGALTSNCVTWWRNYRKANHLKVFEWDGGGKNELGERIDDKGRTKDKIEKMWGDTICSVSKQKVGGNVGEYKMWYDPETYRFKTYPLPSNDSYVNIGEDNKVIAESDEPF